MSIHVKESTMVYPSEETPNHILWLSSLDLIPRMPYSHSLLMYIYGPNNDPKNRLFESNFFDTNKLKESLGRVLVSFYLLAGRLKENEKNGQIEIDCNTKGVLFIEAETSHSLVDFGEFKPTAELRRVVMPTCDYSKGLSSFPLAIVKLTRFKCGGVSIGFGVHHHVGDGVAYIAGFINSWSSLARGLDLGVQPVHDRTSHLAPRKPLQVKFRHLEYEPPLPPVFPKGFSGEMTSTREGLFKLSKSQINALKQEATSREKSNYKLSTYEVLAGHVWRSACKARGLGGDQYVKLYTPTDGRLRLKDPTIPQGYFGNVVFFTACVAKACDITCNPLWYAARKVHEALKKVEDVEYLRSAVDYLESQPNPTALVRGPHTTTCPNLSINSWARMPFYEADFGWGRPNFVGHGGIRNEGQSFFVPSPNENGGFSLAINLFTAHMPLFENYLYAINGISSL